LNEIFQQISFQYFRFLFSVFIILTRKAVQMKEKMLRNEDLRDFLRKE
jgi:hypothetical protein